ncbi:MAG: hypothetical protein ACON4Z_13595 [Planctomycetota bacterium]
MTAPDNERLLTLPLVAFLLAAGLVVGAAALTRYPSPDLDGCVELLADGDLDREEREHVLARTLSLAADGDARGRIAGCLAALSLQQRRGFDELEGALAEAGRLPEAARRWLDLGDPLLHNVLRASCLQAADPDAAAKVWSQVAAQARMVGNELAAELAARRRR